MSLVCNLEKSEQTLRLCLQKAGVHTPPEAEVGFNLDVSGSFEREHLSGDTAKIMTRLIPWAMVFDPDKKLDLFTFSDGANNVVYVGEVTTSNYSDFIATKVIKKVRGWMGGTTYSHVLEKNLRHFGWLDPLESDDNEDQPEEQGFFSSLKSAFFGKAAKTSKTVEKAPQKKSLILFITDGDNQDKDRTQKLLKLMEKEEHQVYIMFFGFSEDKSVKFGFLQEIADKFSNTGLYICRDLKQFIEMEDSDINELIISDELIAWLTK